MTSRPLRIRFAPIARSELIERAAFYATEAGESVSDRFVESVAQTIDLLTRMPKIGRIVRRQAVEKPTELRRIPLSGAFRQTLLIYSCGPDELRVERLLHCAQNLQQLFD